MKQYIGTKLIQATPAKRFTLRSQDRGLVVPDSDPLMREQIDEADIVDWEKGYQVIYPDGYTSFSPKGVFEKAYLPLTVNDQLRTGAPSIGQQMVDDFIVAREVTTMGNKCTVVRAVLRNGFEIVESSACVSAANYDEKLGVEICMKKIKDKIWFLLGFLLQTAVTGIDRSAAREAFEAELEEGECCQSCGGCDCGQAERKMTFGDAICAMRRGLKVRRRGWNGKNQHIELASAISYKNPDGTVVNVEHEAIGNQAVAFVGTSGVQLGWLASQADMLAEDWEVVQ